MALDRQKRGGRLPDGGTSVGGGYSRMHSTSEAMDMSGVSRASTATSAAAMALDGQLVGESKGFRVIYSNADGETPAGVNYVSPYGEAQRRRLIEENLTGHLGYRIVKRTFDIVFSGAVIAVLAIPSAAVCIAIYVQSPGNPFYVDKRVGRFGRPLGVLKFRSMVTDAGNVEKYFTPEQLETWHRERKVENDPRITAIGNFLRKTSLDELPQFLNVFVGQMSVIGPRPITEEELENFGPDKDLYLSVLPGITGWWQVNARNNADFLSGERQRLELEYVTGRSLAKDLQVFLGTFGAMAKKTGK